MDSIFKEAWDNELKKNQMPTKFSGVEFVHYDELKSEIDKKTKKFATKMISNFLNGKVYIIKNSFEPNFVYDLKKKVVNFWNNNPDTYYEMKEGCPDFHRVITPDKATKYSLGAVRHSTYFFPWNQDLKDYMQEIYKRWRYMKFVAGLKFTEYEKNTPKDVAIDRIQIVCYPPGCGGVEKHTDTDSNSNLAISCHLSSRKELDFKTGGFYAVDEKSSKIDIEPHIEVGDMSVYCSTVEHGVESIDIQLKDKSYNWNSGIGRWWMGLFCPDSNEIKKRNTSISLETFHSKKV